VNGFYDRVPSGWTHFGGLTNPYIYYDGRQWNVTEGQPVGKLLEHTGRHQADVLAEQAVQHMGAAVRADKPFFVHLSPAMVHYGSCYNRPPIAFDDPWNEKALPCPTTISPTGICTFNASPCPSDRNKFRFSGVEMPRVPSWNRTTSGVRSPAEVRKDRWSYATNWHSDRMDKSWRNRVSG
jgi:hypothetical protein